MPIYEYRCANCNHEMEVLQKVSDAPLVTCPNCAADSLKKKISAAGFRLKGGGWYETDFKSGSKKNVTAGDSSSTTKTTDNSTPAATSSSESSGSSSSD
ncbi:MAG: zinc ribbon domain-containing protein [Gammaproteobacteria bacterium TMED92]|nr:MAG: zinc ribbon domain-containing protein [Gammaproteobacteria bacterium TMED92]